MAVWPWPIRPPSRRNIEAFRDWAAEQTSFPGDWAEAALAHTLPNKVEAAYKRTKFLEQRRKMMAAWAGYLAMASNVVRLATAQ